LHELYENAVSTLLFSWEDVCGNPYDLALDNISYRKMWKFPADIVDPGQIESIRIEVGKNGAMGEDDYIFFDNMSLHFGYSAKKWASEGIILAALENADLTYNALVEETDIRAWVFKDDEKGFRDFDTDFIN
jgi:hypothetical protein